MKKISFLLCVLFLAACSKKEDVAPAYTYPDVVVTYQFKSATKGDYALFYYTASSSKKNVVQFNDTTWSVTDTIKGGANPPTHEVGLGTLQLVSGASFTLKITGNKVGGVKKTTSGGNYPSNTFAAYTSFNYNDLYFYP